MSKQDPQVEYYLYATDNIDDILWYTETIPNDDVGLEQAMKHFNDSILSNVRLDAIYRPSNLRVVIAEKTQEETTHGN